MDLAPEVINGAVVLNGVDICSTGPDCRPCIELAVGVHNWLVAHDLKYLIVDFQDEKEVCSTILTEILQLRKRLPYPFIFCGLMGNPRKVLTSFAYSDHPVVDVPEDAVAYLKKIKPELLIRDLSSIREHEPIPCTRSRTYRGDDAETGDASANESEVEEVEADL